MLVFQENIQKLFILAKDPQNFFEKVHFFYQGILNYAYEITYTKNIACLPFCEMKTYSLTLKAC